MRGILPEHVRGRVGKGSGAGLASQSLTTDQTLAKNLLRGSILEQLGIIDTKRLYAATAVADRGGIRDGSVSASVQATLDVEMWLRVQSGRWGPDDTGSMAEVSARSDVAVRRFTNA
jgi:hypothetical protein